ncbi:hypothetical protein PENTCL1PPCAC_12910, partial [Pristionchus entomophagus]
DSMHASELVGMFLLASSFSTLILHALVLSAVFVERKRVAANAFYTIYMAGCFADILSLINGVFTYCSLTGFLQAHLLYSNIVVHLDKLIVWGARFSQMLTVLMIATNRVTAIRYPLKHLSIWNNVTQRICSFIQITSIFVVGGAFVAFLRPIAVPSSFGGIVVGFDLSEEQLNGQFLFGIILQSTNGLLVLLLYSLIIRKIRSEMRQTSGNSASRHESSLHKVALIVCIVERDTSTIIYIVRTVIYSSIPPYLLLFFSDSVRKRV